MGGADNTSVSIRFTTEAIYGLPQASINGQICNGTLSMSYKIRQPNNVGFRISIALVLVISLISILASYVMTYTNETPKSGWVLIALFAALAMATYSLRNPFATWLGETRAEGATFFYDNVANRRIIDVFRQLEGGMYLSTIQNLFMVVAVRILHLKAHIFVFVQSMCTLYVILCLAPFCSHYFRKYFSRVFRFVCPLIIVCYGLYESDYNYHLVGYCGAYFLLLILIYDFENISNFIYFIIVLALPVVCTSKMTFVSFVPVAIVYYLLYRKNMNFKKKFCIIEIGFFSFMEGFLSVALKHGVQGGHRLGTIQYVTLPTLVNKVLYYTVQTFGIQLRCGISNANQLLENVFVSLIVIGILAFAVWQIIQKRTYCGEAKFIIVMLSLIMGQCALIVLTTTDWHADISWKQSVSRFSGIVGHFTNMFIGAIVIFLVLLWVMIQYFKTHYDYLLEHMSCSERFTLRGVSITLITASMLIYINQHAGPKTYEFANQSRTEISDWPAYSIMLDDDAICMQINPNKRWHYMKNASVKSIDVQRSTSVDLSDVAELDGKTSIVAYAHKTAATNQILDRYYYMRIYDKDGNLISRIRQINSDANRLYIGFYLEEGIPNIGHVEFTYEDGMPAFVDETLEIGYR